MAEIVNTAKAIGLFGGLIRFISSGGIITSASFRDYFIKQLSLVICTMLDL
jgi:hypothetical protein